MQNIKLAEDYLNRAELRLTALDTLYQVRAWADVVRESQEAVELALKALLRFFGIEMPRVHDVSEILKANREIFPLFVQKKLEVVCEHSRSLRRDRELAFYGSEDLTPSDFYREKDAKEARKAARETVAIVRQASRQSDYGVGPR
jgi:HEPN domain-containing protein